MYLTQIANKIVKTQSLQRLKTLSIPESAPSEDNYFPVSVAKQNKACSE